MPNIGSHLWPFELIVRTKLTPALTGKLPPNDVEWDLLALLARLGGIALAPPTQATDIEFLSSTMITEALKEANLQQDFQYTGEVIADQLEAKAEVHRLPHAGKTGFRASERVPPSPPQAVNGPCSRKGVSPWLTFLMSLVLHSTRNHFRMLLLCRTTGNPCILHQHVDVVPSSSRACPTLPKRWLPIFKT